MKVAFYDLGFIWFILINKHLNSSDVFSNIWALLNVTKENDESNAIQKKLAENMIRQFSNYEFISYGTYLLTDSKNWPVATFHCITSAAQTMLIFK